MPVKDIDLHKIPPTILDSIASLQIPPVPSILLQFLRLTEDEKTAITELAALVGQDPSFSARILTVANSPALWRGVEARNLTQCLVNLGIRLSRTLATCLIVQNVFSPTINTRRYNFSGFWKHSLLLAETSRAIASAINHADPEEAYLSGLLHDVGELLLLCGLETRYGDILADVRDEHALRDAERLNLLTDHAAVGAWLVDQWQLSSFMADAILFHHNSAEEIMTADSLSRIVWSAHVLCAQQISDENDTPPQSAEYDAIRTVLGIDIPNIMNLRLQCEARVLQIAEAFGITKYFELKPFPINEAHPETVRIKPSAPDQPASFAEDAVRAMALTHSLQQDLLSLGSEKELLLDVRESARILFGVGNIALLLLQPDKAVLSYPNIDVQPDIRRKLEIPLAQPKSLAATAALEKQARSTFAQKQPAVVSLADIQITRMLGGEGVLYIPLYTPKQIIGVMAFGISSAQHTIIKRQLTWIMSFAQVAAASIETWREILNRDEQLENSVAKHYELRARNVVHEARNPLSIIKNYLNVVKRKLPDSVEIQELDILEEEIDRVTTILRRQVNGYAEERPSRGILDVNKLIESMIKLYGDPLFTDRGIATEISLDPDIGHINCDKDSVKQILLNLWNNASDAMAVDDCFFISTHANINQNGRNYIEIRLRDTGSGIPQDVMLNLFKPLDPNRRPGHSGVGLSIVAGLVERLEGHITCQSSAGRGASFSILLPQPQNDGA